MASSDDLSAASASVQPTPPAPGRDPNLWLLFAVTLVAVGNVSSVAPAFPRVVDVLGVYVLLFGAFLTYVPEVLDARFGAPSLVAGLVLALASVSSGLTATQLGRLSTVVPKRRLIQASLLVDAAALIAIPWAPAPWGVGAAALLSGVAQGLNQPALQTRLTELASDASRGVILSLNGMVLRLGQAVGPLLLGGALALGGLDAVFYAAAAVALLVGGVAVLVLAPASSQGGA